MPHHAMISILPCNDLARSAAFYARLGFHVTSRHEGYWLLVDAHGAGLHLRHAEASLLFAGHNPFGLYLYTEEVDELAAKLASDLLGPVEHKPWGMYEFAVSDPDGTLVRVGRPSRG